MPFDANTKFLRLYNLNAQYLFCAICIFLAVLVIYYWRVFVNLDTHLLGGSSLDAGLYYYLFNHNQVHLLRDWFDAGFYYPYRGTLAWSDNFILPSVLSQPLAVFGLSIPAQYNLSLLFAIGLNGLCTFILAFSLCGLFWTSICTGLIVFFLSFLNENVGHPQLLFFFWLPACLFFIFKFIASKQLWPVCAAFACIALCFLCSVYYALFSALLVVVVLSAVVILRPSWFEMKAAKRFSLAVLAMSIALSVFAIPYINSYQLFGSRHLYESFFLSSNFDSFLSSSGSSLLYSRLAQSLSSEAGLFSGFVLAALIVFGIFRVLNIKSLRVFGLTAAIGFLLAVLLSCSSSYFDRSLAASLLWLSMLSFAYFIYQFGKKERTLGYLGLSNRDLILLFSFAGLFFLILSLGPLANSDWNELAFSPYVLFYYLVPGFSSIRAAYRFAFPGIFCLLMTLPFIFPILQKKARRLGTLVVFALTGLIILENWQTTYPLEELPKFDLVSEKSNQATLVLPLQDYSKSASGIDHLSYARYNVDAMLWSLPNTTLMNGYSGQVPRLHQKLIAATATFPSVDSLNFLASFPNLNRIVLNAWKIPEFDAGIFEQQLSKISALSISAKSETNTYLLNFMPETEIRSERTLFVSADPSKELQLEMKGRVVLDADPCEALVSVIEARGANLLSRIELKSNGEYGWFNVPLAKTKASPKALTISIVNSCAQPIFLRGRLLGSTANKVEK